MDPASTFAIVVGVEKYGAGDKWNLDGPAADALRFTDCLIDRKVPPQNIRAFVSPLQPVTLPGGVQVKLATRDNINEAIRTALAVRDEELLIFFWGGHGVIGEDFTRRLFYSDATAADKKNLDLNDLLLALRSAYFKKAALRQQIVIVDACATFAAKMQWQFALPTDQFSKGVGAPVQGREQFVFLGTRPGEGAVNLDSEKTGIFSRELMKRLAASASWPPDFKSIGEDLIHYFKSLRDKKQADQTPGYSWFRDSDGFDKELGRPIRPGIMEQLKQLDLPARAELTRALLEVPCVLDRQYRDRIVRALPRRMANSIQHANDNFGDVFNILETCLRHPGGFPSFWQIVRSFDSGTEECDALAEVIAKYFPELRESP